MAGVGRKSRGLCVHLFLPGVDDLGTKRVRNAQLSCVDSEAHGNTISIRAARRGGTFHFSCADWHCAALTGATVTSHLMATFARVHLAFERGEGVWLTATDGERYLDFTSGVAVNALGHAHPHLVAALTEQAQKLWHVSNLYEVPEAERVAQRLCDASFADVVFFCNSGAEAVECAIKAARKYQYANG